MEKGRVHLIIRGRVQGVFFRASTRDMAASLGLKGWVKNLSDGNVEALFEGPKDLLLKAVQWCRKGPEGARVTEVSEDWSEYEGEPNSFEIKYRGR
ncbi:MAG: acylphosphatase [Nitrospirae bacterium]|nr:acylphosphatase [Nitrospirota bacterium]